METSGIYCIRCMLNGKVYIGQSKNMLNRCKVHADNLDRGKHHNEHLQNAWTKYGPDEFEFRVLEECPEEMLDIRETSWIAYANSIDPSCGYNMLPGGHYEKDGIRAARKAARARVKKNREEMIAEAREARRRRMLERYAKMGIDTPEKVLLYQIFGGRALE